MNDHAHKPVITFRTMPLPLRWIVIQLAVMRHVGDANEAAEWLRDLVNQKIEKEKGTTT